MTGLQWFKIYEDGLDPSTQTWAVDTLIANKGKVSFTIPSCIEPGQYLLRHEIIALHAASTYPGAQLYVSSNSEEYIIAVLRDCSNSIKRWNAHSLRSLVVVAQIHRPSVSPALTILRTRVRSYLLSSLGVTTADIVG